MPLSNVIAMGDKTNWPKLLGEALADQEIAHNRQIEALTARIAELEARPTAKGEPGELPAELAEQIDRVKQLLQEPLPVAREVELPRRVTGTDVTNDGQLLVMYSDGTSERRGSVIGPAGPAGVSGPQGAAGRDGANGEPGLRGRDGISIAGAAFNSRKELMLTLSDGTVLIAGRIEGGK